MNLAQNRLNGSIPAELGRLTQLRVLYLHRNPLTGPISAELGQLVNLESLYVGGYPAAENNWFTGCIPPALQKIPSSNLDRLGLPVCESAR